MANLVKIGEVFLYVGLSTTGADQYAAKKLLDDAGITYNTLAYFDDAQHDSVFNSLNTWVWGRDAQKKALTDFPIVHWKEYYDDYENNLQVAHGLKELKDSPLLANAKLVVKNN